MKQNQFLTNVIPETCAELDSVSTACGTNYQVSPLKNYRPKFEIEERSLINASFHYAFSAMTTVVFCTLMLFNIKKCSI